jgi:CubicO group peptidase (beta-lactamase class C family)
VATWAEPSAKRRLEEVIRRRWRAPSAAPERHPATATRQRHRRAGQLSNVDAAGEAWVGGEAMSADTVFDVASLTKPVFATAVL